jgi:tyrosinase
LRTRFTHIVSIKSLRRTFTTIRYICLITFVAKPRKTNHHVQWASWNSTLRAPNSGGINAVSLDETIGPILDNSRVSFRDRLYNLFTFYGNYSEFSTESYTFGTAFKNADSLESIHDVIHGATGSGGHMTYLDYSAYDPIFWLHHMMVDRAFALWQAVNPDSYVVPTSTLQDSYTITHGQILDGDTRRFLALVVLP